MLPAVKDMRVDYRLRSIASTLFGARSETSIAGAVFHRFARRVRHQYFGEGAYDQSECSFRNCWLRLEPSVS